MTVVPNARPHRIPPGGTTGDALVKASDDDYDVDWVAGGGGGGVTDHGLLNGLADDDHPQYHNDARGDARYWQLTTDLATQVELDSEASTRAAADTALDGRLDTLEAISFATDAELASHEADTTGIHGIADTTVLETTVGAQAKVDAHVNDTSDAHDASAISVADAGGLFTGTDVEAVLTELVGMGGGDPQSPWLSNIDADGFNLVDVGIALIGKSTQASVPGYLEVGPTFTNTAAGNKAIVGIYPVITHDTTAGGAYYALNAVPQIGGSANITTIAGLNFVPTISNSGTVTTSYGALVGNDRTTGTTTTAYGVFTRVFAGSFSTVTTGVGVEIQSPAVGAFGALTTMIGLRITSLTGGTTRWGMQVGDYQSYHHGRMTFGAATAPTYGIDLKGTAQDRGVIGLTESTATPTNPTASGQCVIYMKADKLVIGYLDGATMRYKYLDLTGTGVTWVHDTTAP